MLFLKGYETCVQIVFLMSRAAVGGRSVDSMQSLRKMYLDALEYLSPALAVSDQTHPSAQLIVTEGTREQRLARLFSPSALDDLHQSSVMGMPLDSSARAQQSELLDKTLEFLERECPEFEHLFRLLVHGVILRDIVKGQSLRNARAGTTSSAPGVIWMTYMPDYGVREISEILVHELAHTMLFIDEIINPQFHSANLKKPDNICMSPILQKKRPVDKVVHGIIVATEIVLARNTVLAQLRPDGSKAHPKTHIMARNVLDCAKEVILLNRRSKVITPHTQELMESCIFACGNYLEKGKPI